MQFTDKTDTRPWLAPLDEQARQAVRSGVAQAPELTIEQRRRLRSLFTIHADRASA